MEWIDITRPLSAELAGWPGDTPVRLTHRWNRSRGDSVNVGQLEISLHTGTHCDAPVHFLDHGASAEHVDPVIFCGPALIIDARKQEHLGTELIPDETILPERILIRTDRWTESTCFPRKIPVLTPELVNRLATNGVKLIGVDLPSVDALDCSELPNHHALHQAGITILEGLDLQQVAAGVHDMLALPLLIPDADGSPVRALLRPATDERA